MEWINTLNHVRQDREPAVKMLLSLRIKVTPRTYGAGIFEPTISSGVVYEIQNEPFTES